MMRAIALGTDSPRVRESDPITSHLAAARAVSRIRTRDAIIRVLAVGVPMTADEIWATLRQEGYVCSRERVRTVLNEGSGQSKRARDRFNAFARLDETAPSELGNPAHLWTIAKVNA